MDQPLPGPCPLAGPGRCGGAQQSHRDDRDQGGLLHRRRQRHGQGCQDEPPLGREPEGHDDQGDHDGVIVGTAEKVEHGQRVQHTEPQGEPGIPAERGGDAGQQSGDDHQRSDCGQPHPHGGRIRVAPHEVDNGMLDLQRERAVGRWGPAPEGIDLLGELAAEQARTHGIRVQAQVDDPALGRITVGVAAEQGRSEQ